MPLDSTGISFYKLATWSPRFAWWPQRCAESGQWIWMTTAYHGAYDRRHWDGRYYSAWLTANEYLICMLNGAI